MAGSNAKAWRWRPRAPDHTPPGSAGQELDRSTSESTQPQDQGNCVRAIAGRHPGRAGPKPRWYNDVGLLVIDEQAGGWGRDDTDPEALRIQAAVLRRLSVWRRLAQVDQLFELTTSMALADLRRRNSGATEAELRLALAERLRRAAVPPSRDRA